MRAILEAFQPGQLGGDAICDILDGTAVPSGKLPYTVHTEAFAQARDIRDMERHDVLVVDAPHTVAVRPRNRPMLILASTAGIDAPLLC